MVLHSSKSLLGIISVAALTASCVAEEPLNKECDIERAVLHLSNASEVLDESVKQADCSIASTETDIFWKTLTPTSVVGEAALTLYATPGARILNADGSPYANGSTLHFGDEQRHNFRVVSEDGQWERLYTFSIVKPKGSAADEADTYSFKSNFNDPHMVWANESKGTGYYEWPAEGDLSDIWMDGVWKNGNPGFKLSKSSAMPEEYPSTLAVGAGPDGSNCVKLETMSTGSFGAMVKMPIAAGSFFNGEFDTSNATKAPLKATRFGSSMKYKPVSVNVWLRFEPGDVFCDEKGNTVPDVVDEPDFYVVVYRNTDAEGNKIMLQGDNVLTSPQIVGIARLPHRLNADGSNQMTNDPIHGVTAEWKEFTFNIDYREPLDPEVLAAKGYSIVIGASSSWFGATFKGACTDPKKGTQGNRLYLDNMSINVEN